MPITPNDVLYPHNSKCIKYIMMRLTDDGIHDLDYEYRITDANVGGICIYTNPKINELSMDLVNRHGIVTITMMYDDDDPQEWVKLYDSVKDDIVPDIMVLNKVIKYLQADAKLFDSDDKYLIHLRNMIRCFSEKFIMYSRKKPYSEFKDFDDFMMNALVVPTYTHNIGVDINWVHSSVWPNEDRNTAHQLLTECVVQ